MKDLVEYKRFADELDAQSLIKLLKQHSIPYELQEPVSKFRLVENPEDDYVIISIKASDFQTVDELQEENDNNELEKIKDHFLFTFSDEDIIDVIVNPSEWSNLEIKIAKKIAKDRDLKITSEHVQSLREIQKTEVKKKVQEERNPIKAGANWLIWIGALSIMNLIAYVINQDLMFILGLNINSLFIGFAEGMQVSGNGDFWWVSLTIGLIISSLFIWLGVLGKKKRKNAYLIGLILYFLDALLSIFVKDWIMLGFHMFVLMFVFSEYLALISNKRKE